MKFKGEAMFCVYDNDIKKYILVHSNADGMQAKALDYDPKNHIIELNAAGADCESIFQKIC